MKFKPFLIAFLTIITTQICQSQKSKTTTTVTNGYTVTIATKNLQNEKLVMYMLYGTNKQQVITDSITIKSNNQKVVFKKDKKMLGVIYFLRLASQNNALELAIDNDSKIDLTLESTNIASIICTKNNLNKEFIAYQLQEGSLDNDKKIALRKSIAQKYPTSILNLYFTIENKIFDKKPENENDQIKFRDSYLRAFNKDDKRIFLLPNIYRLLYSFVTILPINNENYIKNIDLVLTGIPCSSKNYAVYTRWFISNFNYYDTKNLENAYSHLFKKYIETDKCKTFSDSELAVYGNKYETIKTIAYNSVVPDFTMVDKLDSEHTLSKIYPQNDYTFIAFFSPNCSHCKETMPVVSAFFNNLKSKYPNIKIQTIAIENDPDESKWQEFITHSNIENWLNLKSTDAKRKYQDDFNAYSNPNFFLVNKTGNVILKSYNPMAIEELIQGK